MDKKNIEQIIFSAIDNINQARDFSLQKTPNAKIYGEGSTLDSLGLVSLLIDIEEEISNQTNFPITLMSERAMSQHKSPFNNVSSLVDYVSNLIVEKQNG